MDGQFAERLPREGALQGALREKAQLLQRAGEVADLGGRERRPLLECRENGAALFGRCGVPQILHNSTQHRFESDRARGIQSAGPGGSRLSRGQQVHLPRLRLEFQQPKQVIQGRGQFPIDQGTVQVAVRGLGIHPLGQRTRPSLRGARGPVDLHRRTLSHGPGGGWLARGAHRQPVDAGGQKCRLSLRERTFFRGAKDDSLRCLDHWLIHPDAVVPNQKLLGGSRDSQL